MNEKGDSLLMLAAFVALASVSTACTDEAGIGPVAGDESSAQSAPAQLEQIRHLDIVVLARVVQRAAQTERFATRFFDDIARVTDLGGLNKFYLDLTPHLSPARQKAWADNFASTLPWFRSGPADM